MEAEYGVGIRNRFAFLDDDDNDGDYPMTTVKTSPLKSKNEKKPAEPKSVGAGKPESKAVTAPSAAPKRNAQKERGGGKVDVQDDRKTQRRVEGFQHDDRKNARENGGMSAENGFRNQGLRGRGEGRGDGRGFRRDGPPNRRNFRGRQGENKEGQRNDRDPDSENTVETSGQDMPASTAETKEGDVEQVEAAEGEDGESAQAQEKTLTLAEWKALQVPREKPVFNTRKPGEGEVASKLEKLVLKKREDDLGDQDEEFETDEVYYPQRAGKQKLISDVGFTTGYQKQRRGGKFGGSARVGGGDSSNAVSEPRDTTVDKPRGRPRYGPRGGHSHQSQAPRIDDAADFPTLG